MFNYCSLKVLCIQLLTLIYIFEGEPFTVSSYLTPLPHSQVTAGSAAGSEVARVLAMDGDTGDSGRLSYAIMQGMYSYHCYLGS